MDKLPCIFLQIRCFIHPKLCQEGSRYYLKSGYHLSKQELCVLVLEQILGSQDPQPVVPLQHFKVYQTYPVLRSQVTRWLSLLQSKCEPEPNQQIRSPQILENLISSRRKQALASIVNIQSCPCWVLPEEQVHHFVAQKLVLKNEQPY